MVITVASHKGGVGKSTTAVHLAAYLQRSAPTLLIDCDENRSAIQWGKSGKLPFKIVDERQAAMHARNYENIVIDTKARADEEDLKAVIEGCHLLVIPCTPDLLAINATFHTITTLKAIGALRYRALLTIIPPKPNRQGEEARELMNSRDVPVFASGIRRTVAFQQAIVEGVTVDMIDRTGLGWLDYEKVGDEITTLVSSYTTRKMAV